MTVAPRVGADGPLGRLLADPRRAAALTHVERLPARAAQLAPYPPWVDPLLVQRLTAAGIPAPYRHQAEAADAAHSGEHVILATGTASGKSLGYQLPVLSALLAEPRARALYLSPTKALAHDQLRAVRSLLLTGVRAAAFDGDTAAEERDWVRAHATWVFTNPDLLHYSLLPGHARWAGFLRGLRYVVVDECHTYRGVFGSHVAHVLRRLRRVAARYGAAPTFVLASATVSDPAVSAQRLTGLPVRAVTADGAPHGAVDFALWEPPLTELTGERGAPVRRSAGAEAADLLADLVADGTRTVAFVRSRRGAEVVAQSARRALSAVDADLTAAATRTPPGAPAAPAELRGPGLAGAVAAYRAGLLAEERRAVERGLQDGSVLGVAATSALELGVDITGLDAVLLVGWPGTRASLWQQAGRAGRAGQRALAVLIARDDPLDTYVVHHPEVIFGQPVEATVLDPANPYVLGPQLEHAAADLPLTDSDVPLFGPEPAVRALLDDLVRRGRLRRRPTGWFWTRTGQRPDADIRGTGGGPVRLVESGTGRLLGTVERTAAHSTVHPGAVYLHQGETFLVDELHLPDLPAGDPDDDLHPEDADVPGSALWRSTEPVVAEPVVAEPVVAEPVVADAMVVTRSAAERDRSARGWLPDLPSASGRQPQLRPRPRPRLRPTDDAHSGVALLRAADPDFTTSARDITDIRVQQIFATLAGTAPAVAVGLARVAVTHQVVGFLRRRVVTGEVLAEVPLDLPPRQLSTVAVYYTATDAALSAAGLDAPRVPGAAHAAEHAAIGLLPLLATCDRWDIGGVSTARHPDTGLMTVFVYDGQPGGAGFAERGYALLPRWLDATRAAVAACECPAGCPSCVQSPKCGNGNDPLDKAGAVALLDLVLAGLPRRP